MTLREEKPQRYPSADGYLCATCYSCGYQGIRAVGAVMGRSRKRLRIRAVEAWVCTTLVSFALGSLGSPLLWAQSYPAVRPLRRTFTVSDVAEANVSLDVESMGGARLYHLQCHSAGYTGDPGFDYSGDFECRLGLIGQPNTYSTYLTEDAHQSRDWESRGRFFAADLRGACARMPQFGATRSFKLRGMDLTLAIRDQKFARSGKLATLTLTVTVRPDPGAGRPIAEVVPLPKTGVPAGCKIRGRFVDYSALPGNH
jgi:hypothetical protein